MGLLHGLDLRPDVSRRPHPLDAPPVAAGCGGGVVIEMRWLREPHTSAREPKLQFQVHLPVVDIGGKLCPGEWTEWADVPLVVDPTTHQETEADE